MKTKNILKAIKLLRQEVQIGKDSFMSKGALETLDILYKELANRITKIKQDDNPQDLSETDWADIAKYDKEKIETDETQLRRYLLRKTILKNENYNNINSINA